MHPVFNHVSPYGYLLPNVYLYVADIATCYVRIKIIIIIIIANTELLACGCRTVISFVIDRFYKEKCQPSRGFAKKRKCATHFWGGRGLHNLHSGLPTRCDSCTACRLCGLEPHSITTFSITLSVVLLIDNGIPNKSDSCKKCIGASLKYSGASFTKPRRWKIIILFLKH